MSLLVTFLLKLLEHSSQTTSLTTVDACDVLASLPFTNPTWHKTLHPALDLLAFAYHSCSPNSTFLRSFLTTSLHLFLEPHLGRGCGSQLNSITFGSLWSGILAKWPSHSSLLFCTFSLTVSSSPHLLLTSAMVMRSDHCCLLEMPKMVLMHLWWNVFSRFLMSLEWNPALCSIQED